jgi:Fe(3+) dicitrate transport protein
MGANRRLLGTLLMQTGAACAIAAGGAHAETGADIAGDSIIDRIVVTGTAAKALEVAGAATFIDAETLKRFDYSAINSILRLAPGVYIQDEEGFGLRPDIGIRGSGTDRSERIIIMEDGVPIAPAPYAAAAAYYFPSAARMSGVEVVKGAGAIKYGPRTVGGAIQLFSTPIPDDFGGRLLLSGGSDESVKALGHAGGFVDAGGVEIGGLVEYLHEGSGGFKTLDNGGDTGYRLDDFVGKFALRSKDGASVPQSFEFKFQRSKQDSDETYLGLTLDDFAADPYRRYNGSQLDNIIVDHWLYQATHKADFGGADLTTTAYHTKTERAWYKLNDVRDAGSSFVSLSNVLRDPATYATAYANLAGAEGYVSADDALRVRNNNRRYEATGVQSVLGFEFSIGASAHAVEASVRYHEDEEDRFQNDDLYRIENGAMVLTTAGVPGAQDNRVGSAKAWSFFLRDEATFGAFTLTPGVRYEKIKLTRVNYGAGDLLRTGSPMPAVNDIDVWIPGVAAKFQASEALALFGGVHRGFANPGPGSSAKAEESINWEAGLRYGAGAVRAEFVGFYNDYDNLVGTCTASTGGGCTIGDQFDGGQVVVKGLEASLGLAAHEIFGLSRVNIPLSVVYTFSDGEFGSSFTSAFSPWGTVTEGDDIPYLPSHQLTVGLGYEIGPVRLDALINTVSKTRSRAGSGVIAADNLVDARTIVDLAAAYEIREGVAVKLKAENIFDEVYNVGFRPSGARPGKPRTLWAGIDVAF